MNKNLSIQIKAAFLFIVFALNTVIGFACAMGMDMRFNSHHHQDVAGEALDATVHVHASGAKHLHHKEAAKNHHDSKENSEKGGCCSDAVIKFQGLDKNINSKAVASTNLPVFAAIIINNFNADFINYTQVSAQKYPLPFFHPPPRDIRILIQSFLI